MKNLRCALLVACSGALIFASADYTIAGAASSTHAKDDFRTSDRCVACHNDLKTKSGENISIGMQWRASVMANSSRDPYWQGSVRREILDHPEAAADIQNECSTCHMPMVHLQDREAGRKTDVFGHLPLAAAHERKDEAADGVSCSVCHRVAAQGLGTDETFNGNVALAPANAKQHYPEFGPFEVDQPLQTVMVSSTKGFVPQQGAHMRDSALCGSCHTLRTAPHVSNGKTAALFPEQVPYQEWLHSGYRDQQSCQSCHMPEVKEPTRVASVFGPEREGMRRHVFIGGNILLPRLLSEHRDDLAVKATAEELTDALQRTREFLTTRSARLTIPSIEQSSGKLQFAVQVENLTGHKLPTAYPSRRAWLHVTVRDQFGRIIFESGHLNPDGSIVGNDNDADPARFEPHYSEITRPDEVEIYEPILQDENGRVTTGLINAVDYSKDNRLLPHGFDKRSADREIRVVGSALDDPNFNDGGSQIRYAIETGSAQGPFRVEAELEYQPVGFRWAHNLAPYKALEPQRFVQYYEAASADSAIVLATAAAAR